jgi:hypothetical protein
MSDNGRIALFVDGLDEMPDTLRQRAVERLTAETVKLRVTLTSRPDEYRAALDSGQHLAQAACGIGATSHPPWSCC